jgi:hypothetical protein
MMIELDKKDPSHIHAIKDTIPRIQTDKTGHLEFSGSARQVYGSIGLRLDTSTKDLKQVYTSTQEI